MNASERELREWVRNIGDRPMSPHEIVTLDSMMIQAIAGNLGDVFILPISYFKLAAPPLRVGIFGAQVLITSASSKENWQSLGRMIEDNAKAVSYYQGDRLLGRFSDQLDRNSRIFTLWRELVADREGHAKESTFSKEGKEHKHRKMPGTSKPHADLHSTPPDFRTSLKEEMLPYQIERLEQIRGQVPGKLREEYGSWVNDLREAVATL